MKTRKRLENSKLRIPKTGGWIRAVLLCYLLSSIDGLLVCAQPTAFTYQGQLTDNGSPANGIYDLRFIIYNSVTNGTSLGVATNIATGVNNGLFTVMLDFGDVFPGDARWVEIGVRTNGSPGSFTAVLPRQPITSTPYAIRAGTAQEANQALNVAPNTVHDESVIDGSLLANDLAPGQVVKSLNTLRDEVELLEGPNISIVTAPGTPGTITVSGSGDWRLSGNAGTAAGLDFVGTTDNQALELKVNNQRALRLEPTAGAPNVIGGAQTNTVTGGAMGATIGGGSNNKAAAVGDAVGGGYWNQAVGGYSVVGGGEGNMASGYHAVVGGGQLNLATNGNATVAGGILNVAGGPGAFVGGGGWDGMNVWGNTADAPASTVGGGVGNRIDPDADSSTIGGGVGNTIDSFAWHSSIGGGYSNTVSAYAYRSTIGGGSDNTIDSNDDSSTISGGYRNTISASIGLSTIGGGAANEITNANYSTIGGGYVNTIFTNAHLSTIGGGYANKVLPNAYESTIGGGTQNMVGPNASRSTIGGGMANLVKAEFGTIAGGGDPANPLLGNRVFDDYGSVGGGSNNRAGTDDGTTTDASYATVAGGGSNWATDQGATISGGLVNEARGVAATVGGGEWNAVYGDFTTIAGGRTNNISAESAYSAICGGYENTIASYSWYATIAAGILNAIGANSDGSAIGGGSINSVADSSFEATIAGGALNQIGTNSGWSTIGGGIRNIVASNASCAAIPGGDAARATHFGQHTYASGAFWSATQVIPGSAQTSTFVLRAETSDGAWNELFLDGVGYRMTIPTNSTWTFDILIAADGVGANSAGYQIRGVIKNVLGTTSFLIAPLTTVLGEDVAAWDARAQADDTNDALVIEVMGVNGITIRWVASVRTTEVTH